MPCSQTMSISWSPPRASDERNPARLPALNIRIRKSSSRNIGSATWTSTRAKSPSNNTPPAISPITHGLPQPMLAPPYGWIAYVKPTRTSVSPTAKRTLPGMSRRWCCRIVAVSWSIRYAHAVPNRPNGTLSRKTARQSIAAIAPPTSSPTNIPARTPIWFTPIANPRWSGGNASVRMAAEFAIRNAPPTA